MSPITAGEEGQAWLLKTFHVIDILPYLESSIGLTIVGPGKNFKMKALGRLENAVLKLVFSNMVFRKRSILLIFKAEFTERVL